MSGAAAGPPFSWNLFTDLRAMLEFEFVRNAFEAGTIIAIVAGLIGYFVVLRRSSFASHALGHTGFSGAAAAVLVGAQPVYGLLIFTIATASGMAFLGNRASSRDVEIGTVLAFALALGLLFLSLYQGYATEAYSILFGEVLGISAAGVSFTFWTSLVVFGVLAIIYRPLLFSSLDEDVAEAKGLPMGTLNLAFMVLLAVTISIAVQIIGVLLIFALMVTPAAIAVRLTRRTLTAVLVAILVAVTATWAGLFIGWYEPYPVSFFIVAIVFVEYVVIRGIGVLRESSFAQAIDAPERQGVRRLRNASLTASLAGILLVGGGVLFAYDLLAHPGAAWTSPRVLQAAGTAVTVLALGTISGAASFVQYLAGFRMMSSSSREFAVPAFLTLVGLLGILLGTTGLGLFLAGTALAATSYGLAPVAVLFGTLMLLLGVGTFAVGLYGQAVGGWRVGLRYGEGSLRIGAALMWLPFVGTFLTGRGYQLALTRLPPTSTVIPTRGVGTLR
jgi:zinc/manganese transport system permease protein